MGDRTLRVRPPASKSDETVAGEWKVYVDGSSNTKGSGAGVIIESPEGLQLSIRCISTSQLQTIKREYEALIAGFFKPRKMRPQELRFSPTPGLWRLRSRPIEDYLERGLIPDDAMEAKMLVRDAAKYTMVEDQLYRKGLHSPMLRCLNPNEAGKSILSQGEIANSEALAVELDRPMRLGHLPLSGYSNEATDRGSL
ncbi:hypothetical protein K1719_029263 [Acacia pycnantha]|nr:hypothetical protein K1719_029263 [Acacia pycnantha]